MVGNILGNVHMGLDREDTVRGTYEQRRKGTAPKE